MVAFAVGGLQDWFECLPSPADDVRLAVELVEMALAAELKREVAAADFFGLFPDLLDPTEKLAALAHHVRGHVARADGLVDDVVFADG